MPDIKGAGEGAASKGKGALTHKVGPLPLWGWAVAGVAAVIVVKKFTGGGGGAGPGLVTIPSVGSAAPPAGGTSAATDAIGSPSGNAQGGTPSQPSGTPPWWAPSGTSFLGGSGTFNEMATARGGGPMYPVLPGLPSTNGSAGAGPATTTPTGVPQGGSWWTKFLNPKGNLPAGASVTTIGGTDYSLSSDALARAGIPGASAPVAPAASPATTTVSPTSTPQPRPWDRFENT